MHSSWRSFISYWVIWCRVFVNGCDRRNYYVLILNQSKDRTIHRRHFVSSTQFTFIMIFHPIQIKANAKNIFDHDTVWKRLENEFRALFFNRIMHNGIYLNLKPHLYFPFIFSWCCQSSWLTPSNGNTNNKWMRYFLFPPRYVSFASLHLLHVILS